jgi:2'-5' RNA ligase
VPEPLRLLDANGRPLDDWGDRGAAIPHVLTFGGILNQVSQTYSFRYDEAIRNQPDHALAMRRDSYIRSLLQERAVPTANRKWKIATEDPKDRLQRATAAAMTAIVKRTPKWRRFVKYLMEAIWYGRYGSQVVWRQQKVQGQERWCIARHKPVNGDKIQFGWDDVPRVFINMQGANRYPKESIVYTDRVPALKLERPEWRRQFIIHQHELDDADYFEGEMAGGVHGVGLRHMIYWSWWLRDEMLSWAVDYMKKVGTMGLLIFPFMQGNAKSKQKAEENAQAVSHQAALTMPVTGDPANDQLLQPIQVQANTSGIDALRGMIADYFEGHMERLVVGQSMSSGADTDGSLGGTGKAKFAEDTKWQLLKFDADNVADTMTTDLVAPAQQLNWPEYDFQLRFEFLVEDPESADKMEGLDKGIGWGLKFRADDAREVVGFAAPEEGDETIGGKPQGGPGGAPGGPGGGGGPPAPNPEDDGWGDGAGGDDQFDAFFARLDPEFFDAGWDESEHARNKGKFSSKPGAAGGSAGTGGKGAAPKADAPADSTPAASKGGRMRQLLGMVASVPTAIRRRAVAVAGRMYGKLEAKYGPTGAKLIMGGMVALMPIPLPGTSVLPIALAEGVRRVRKLFAKPAEEPALMAAGGGYHEDLAEAIREGIVEFFKAFGQHAPPIDEADLDAVARRLADVSEQSEQFSKHRFCSTQIDLDGAGRAALLRLAGQVADADLADHGREDQPHVTVRYGLEGVSAADVASVVGDYGTVRLKLGAVSCFEGAEKGKDFDVVKVEVESEDLQRLNRMLGRLPHTDTHHVYRPHATIAYVKAGRGRKYAEQFKALNAETLADAITFSDTEGNRSTIPLSADGVLLFAAEGDPECYGWDANQHPRDDKGEFVPVGEIDAARSDPAKKAALRERVRNPEQRAKLDALLAKDEHSAGAYAKHHAANLAGRDVRKVLDRAKLPEKLKLKAMEHTWAVHGPKGHARAAQQLREALAKIPDAPEHAEVRGALEKQARLREEAAAAPEQARAGRAAAQKAAKEQRLAPVQATAGKAREAQAAAEAAQDAVDRHYSDLHGLSFDSPHVDAALEHLSSPAGDSPKARASWARRMERLAGNALRKYQFKAGQDAGDQGAVAGTLRKVMLAARRAHAAHRGHRAALREHRAAKASLADEEPEQHAMRGWPALYGFDPNEARDRSGLWTSGGSSGAAPAGGKPRDGVPPGDQAAVLSRVRKAAQEADLNDPMGEGKGVNIRGRVPKQVGDQFDAHGTATLESLTKLLNGGVDLSREFYSSPLSQAGGGYGVTVRDDSAFVALGHPGQTIKAGGIGGVIVDGHHAGSIPDLKKAFPGVKFISAKDAPELLAKVAAGFGKPVRYAAGDRPELYRSDAGRWITIGGTKGADGKRKGGSPVFVRDGKIVKGHPSLTGKKISALDDAAEGGSHRTEVNRSKEHAKAVWAKKARAEGIKSEHLHALAAEIRAHSKAAADEHNEVLKVAREMAKAKGFDSLQGIHLQEGKKDAAMLRGFDEIADHVERRYPGLFSDPTQHVADQLLERLMEGNRQPAGEDDAYEQAFDTLMDDKHRRKGAPPPDDDDEIPFQSGAAPETFNEE